MVNQMRSNVTSVITIPLKNNEKVIRDAEKMVLKIDVNLDDMKAEKKEVEEMYASSIGSTNDASVGDSRSVPQVSSMTTPLVTAVRGPSTSTGMLRKVSGIFRTMSTVSQPGENSGYVEFGHLDSSAQPTSQSEPAAGSGGQKKTLGTFSGVFSPVAISMFSNLIFIRVGYVVGNAGLLVTLAQFAIAYAILIFTVASVCAISTNGAVEGGGAYFMISRTLGPEFGGSIGTLFFLANVVSSALSISACTEGLVENLGPSGYLIPDNGSPFLESSPLYRMLYSSGLNGVCLALCLIGAAMFAKTNLLVLTTVTISLFSVIISFFVTPAQEISLPAINQLVPNSTHVKALYTGLNQTTLQQNMYASYGQDYTSAHGDFVTFAAAFGVLFSGVTGIMAGANMSGELRNPGRSIPVGTLSAVVFTLVSYITLAVLSAATCSRFLLQNNYMYMMPINVWSPFVAIGLLTATFSAALSNLIGASRVLLALAKDQVFGPALQFISRGTFRGNPIVAVFVSWFLVQLMLFIGSLNLIAQVNSVLFLLSYLATNLACVGLQLTSAPNFRPSFTFFSVHTAALGLLGTIAMMFVISPSYASCSIAACIALVVALHLFTSERGNADAPPYWGSISQALIFHQVRKYLLLLDSRKEHVKYWRPQMLLLINSPRGACPLIDFVNDIKKSGLYVLGHVYVQPNSDRVLDVSLDSSSRDMPTWLSLVDFLKVKAFVELTTAQSVRAGFQHLVRISGMGAMKPNTIILGFHDTEEPVDFFNSEDSVYRTSVFDDANMYYVQCPSFPLPKEKSLDSEEYVHMISDALKMGKNVCLARHFHKLNKASIPKSTSIRYIDVWAVNVLKPFDAYSGSNFDTTSLFMMQLATICTMVSVWKKLKIRIFVRIKSSEDIPLLEEALQKYRIRATIHQIENWRELNSGNEEENGFDYIRHVNRCIQTVSGENTAVTFLYLPRPPTFSSTDNEFMQFHDWMSRSMDSSPQYDYLRMLTELTDNLPPTLLVYGINAVTTTTL